ncbi:cyclin [Emydomyces testavorans]|uniref:Cyclin n=1 Tax=Emydomyces testavorans TaxID=2070801 RepID=A0AAF0DI39_9EURO|nr:cyclin [Emydomyces testavorans]
MSEKDNMRGASSPAAPMVAERGGFFTVTPIETLTILCLHVNSIVSICGDISYTALLQRQSSDETVDNESPGGTRDETLIRKFFSKQIPAVSLKDYLLRLHQYCPMSAAVYLAASWYITRMALVERAIPVTAHNAHRLVLGGLRVATKVLEDLHHSHQRFSRVGGVTEKELTRLEISFCYLMDFDLKIDGEILAQEITMFQERCNVAFPGNRVTAEGLP